MIVCVCRRVSDREITRHAQAGLDFDTLQFELGVATQCGRCEGCARQLVAQCAAEGPHCGSAQVLSLPERPVLAPLPLAA